MSGHNREICGACLEKEYEEYRHARVHELMARNESWIGKFKIGDWGQWFYDHEAQTLTFSEGGHATVVADIVAAGVDANGRWEWSWGNPNIPAKSREMMDRIRSFGEEKEWPQLTTLFLDSDEHLGWEFSAISAHILNADGVYKCPLEDAFVVYTLAFNTRFIH